MLVSKCCGAKIYTKRVELKREVNLSKHETYFSYLEWFCSKCHKPCELIDLQDRGKEQNDESIKML